MTYIVWGTVILVPNRTTLALELGDLESMGFNIGMLLAGPHHFSATKQLKLD